MEEQEKFWIQLTYQGKSVDFEVEDVNRSLDSLLDNVRKAQDANGPVFNMPEINDDGGRIIYYFGRKQENGKQEILQPVDSNREEMTLEDYNVQCGDSLIILREVIAG